MSRKRLLAKIISAVVAADMLVMLFLHWGIRLTGAWEPLVDGLLLGALLTPVFYLWLAGERSSRVRSERALASFETRFRDLVEQSLSGIYIIQQGRFRYVNPKFAEVFGYRREELAGMRWQSLVAPEDLPMVAERIRRRETGGVRATHYAFRGLRRDGDTVDVEIFGSATEFEGAPAAIGTLLDITERRRSELQAQRHEQIQAALIELLRISLKEARLEQALGDALDSILSIDWLALERQGAVFLAGSGQDVLRMAASSNLPEAIRSSCESVPFGVCMCGTAARTGRVLFCDSVCPSHTRSYAGMEPHGHYCVPLRLQERTAGLLLLYVRQGHRQDPAELEFLTAAGHVLEGMIARSRLTEALLQAQKMEAVGSLAGGIAHDFGNILAAVRGASELALQDLRPGDPQYPALDMIRDAAERAQALVGRLSAFSRKQPARVERLDLDALVSDVEGMLRRLLGARVRLELGLGKGLGPILADKVQVEQVLLNLAVNARDAMPQGGRLGIETREVLLDVAQAAEAGCAPGAYVLLSVSDTGCGMTPEVRARLFEPFFTTKPPGKGTGLGLSTVYGIVRQVGGGISVDSRPGQGATFRIYFPKAQTLSPAPAPR